MSITQTGTEVTDGLADRLIYSEINKKNISFRSEAIVFC